MSETGIIAEFKKHGIRSRVGRNRVDLKHQWMDPLIVAAPYLIADYAAYKAGTALTGALSGGRDDDESSWRMATRRRRAQVAGYDDHDFDDAPVARRFGAADDAEFDDPPVARRYGPAGTGRPGMR